MARRDSCPGPEVGVDLAPGLSPSNCLARLYGEPSRKFAKQSPAVRGGHYS